MFYLTFQRIVPVIHFIFIKREKYHCLFLRFNYPANFATFARSYLETGIYLKALWYYLVSHSSENQFNAKLFQGHILEGLMHLWAQKIINFHELSLKPDAQQMSCTLSRCFLCKPDLDLVEFGIWILWNLDIVLFCFFGGIFCVWLSPLLHILVMSLQGDAQWTHISAIQ